MDTKQKLATVLILGLALAYHAFANVVYDSESVNEWFSVDVSTLTTANLKSAPWASPTNGEAAVESAVIKLDTDLGDPLVYTPSANNTNVVTITATIEATVNASYPDLGELGLPQAALAVVTNTTDGGALKWCGLVGGTSASWVSFDSPNPTAGAAYTVNIDIDNRVGHKKIRYRLGDMVLGTGWYENPQTDKTSVESVAFAGTGDIGDFSGSNIVANAATYDGVGYATAAAAFAAADNANWPSGKEVTLYADATYTGTKTGTIYVNANGHQFTIDGEVVSRGAGNTYTITLKTDCEAKIGDNYYATFDEAVAAAGASDTIVVNRAISKDLTVAKSYGLDPAGKLTCTTLTVDAGKTLTLAGALAVTTATVNGSVAGDGVLTVRNLTGWNVAHLALADGAVITYDAAHVLSPTSVAGITINGLSAAEIGDTVLNAEPTSWTAGGLAVGKCLKVEGGALKVAAVAQIDTPTEGKGYDYTNGTVNASVTLESGTGTAVLTVMDANGSTVKYTNEKQLVAGAANPLSWDLAELTQGGAYTYTVDVKVGNTTVASRNGEFTAAKWGADGSWFKADASSGSSVVAGGAWDGTTPEIVNNKYAVSDSAFNVTSGTGTSKLTRVDTKVSFESLPDGTLDVPEGDAVGGFVATTSGWKALTLVEGVKTWVTLTGADTPAVNTEYAIRAELDFSNASSQRVRFFVAKADGDFIPLAYNGSQWLMTTKDQQTLKKVEFQGEGALESIKATVEDKALAEVDGTKYESMADALAAARDDSGKSVELLTNVTLAPTVAGTYKIDRNGYSFNLKLPADWTSEWDEETGMLTVIDMQTPFVQELAASTIAYGQALSASELTGVMTNKNGAVVGGVFAWMNPAVTPAVSDSDTTEYGVKFTPTEATKYFEVDDIEAKVTVTAAVLTVTATDVEVVWGNAPTYGRTITGFVLDDTENVVGGTATYTCGYDTDKGANPATTTTFGISYKDGLTAANYTFAAATTPGTLTVKKAVAEYAGTYYETLTEAVATAGATEGAKVTLQADTTETLSIPQNVELDFNGFEAKGITTAGKVDVEVPADSGSGTKVLDVVVTDPLQVKVTVADDSKRAVVTVNEQSKAVVTIETRPELVTAIEVAGKALPSPDDNSDFKAWLDENIAAYKAANTGTDAISTELNDLVAANGISKLNNYLLFSKNVADVTADDVVAIEKLAVDTLSDGIRIAVPTIENPKADAMGYKIVYRVMKGETKVQDFESQEDLKVPLSSGTGTYRVDAVIVPDNN